MDIVAKILSSLLITVVVGVVLALMRVHGDAPRGLVRYTKFMGIISTVLLVLMTGFAVISAFAGAHFGVPLLFCAVSLVPAGLLLTYFNFRIRYDDQGFEVKGVFGVARKYTYDQITGIKQGTQDVQLHMGKRRVSVDDFMLGGPEFIAYAQKQYKRQTNGAHIPPVKPKIDPFKGHVREPGLYVFLIILLGVISVGLFIFSIFFTVLPPADLEKATKEELCFVSYQIENEDLLLYTEDNQLCKIQHVGNRFDTNKIREICKSRTPVTVSYKQINASEKDGGSYFDILTISDGPNEIFAFSQYVQLHRKANLVSIPLTFALVLFWLFGLIGTLVVGRNPGKHKKWIVHIFFGKGHIKY